MALKPYFVSIVGHEGDTVKDKVIQVAATSVNEAIGFARDTWEPEEVDEITVYADPHLTHQLVTYRFDGEPV